MNTSSLHRLPGALDREVLAPVLPLDVGGTYVGATYVGATYVGTAPMSAPMSGTGLVARPSDWPGINSAQAIIEGKPLKGTWYDRTKEFAARNSGKRFHAKEFATEYEIVLDPLPCWAHLEPTEYQRRVQGVVNRIEERTAERHLRQGTVPLGSAEVLKRHPHQRPNKVKWSPAPLIHAASKKVRWEFFNAYQAVFAAYHEAAEKLREGHRNVPFPEGCFPPRLPFVKPIRLELSG